MPRARRLENDSERGLRVREVCRTLFPEQSRTAVGKRLGVSGGAVRNWELGLAPPPEARERRERLLSRLSPSIVGLTRMREAF